MPWNGSSVYWGAFFIGFAYYFMYILQQVDCSFTLFFYFRQAGFQQLQVTFQVFGLAGAGQSLYQHELFGQVLPYQR